MKTTTLVLVLMAAAPAKDEPLAPWASNRHPSDAPKRHIQDVTEGKADYAVAQGGTMDGENTRSPQGCWDPFEQAWESNRSVRIENTGETDVVNPWLSNGRNGFRTVDEIVASAVTKGMTDKEKAFALWWQEIRTRWHWGGDNNELGDPVKVFNVYGHNTCGNDSMIMASLWKRAGLKIAPARLVGHCVTQVFYDGAWHLMDGDMHSIYLLRDNETVAGEQDIVRDHDLVRRTHTQGLLHPDRRPSDEWESSIYVFEGEVNGDRNSAVDTTMNFTLRPGEALTWRWGHLNPMKFHGVAPKNPDRLCNGLWEYRPDFSKASWRKGAASAEGIRETPEGLAAADEGRGATVAWTIRSPYVIVGGRLESEGRGVKFEISADGKTWEDIGTDLDKQFPAAGAARYGYHLRCRLSGDARLKKLAIVNDLQMAPLSLPGMIVGKNAFAYSDQSKERKVRITHEWVERSATKPPEAPATAVSPADKGEAEGTDVVFQWKPAADPDGDKIADYHFELSARADMKWPLSMSFAKLISRTADAGKARYALPSPGLLNPDRPYYWRVRARDEKGVWGAWSKAWSFTAKGPTSPLEVSLQSGKLRWKPNPLGRKPAKYRVYGSDEKGFTVSDEPYKVTVGISKQVPPEFPANFVGETSSAEWSAEGKAFYRVVAVDAAGKRSGPSEYVAAPRPAITSKPVVDAKVGTPYRAQVSATRSLGDLRTRVLDGREVMNFWDVEKLTFSLVKGPAWLKLDPATGALSGTPDGPGKAEVEVTVLLERELRKLDEATLKWGQEKVAASGVEKGGTVTQKSTIDVKP